MSLGVDFGVKTDSGYPKDAGLSSSSKKSFFWSGNFVYFFLRSPQIEFFQIWVFLCKTRHLVGAQSQATASPRDSGTDNASGIINIWGPSPPRILQIHSQHEVANGTASHVPLRLCNVIANDYRHFFDLKFYGPFWDLDRRAFVVPISCLCLSRVFWCLQVGGDGGASPSKEAMRWRT